MFVLCCFFSDTYCNINIFSGISDSIKNESLGFLPSKQIQNIHVIYFNAMSVSFKCLFTFGGHGLVDYTSETGNTPSINCLLVLLNVSSLKKKNMIFEQHYKILYSFILL